MKRMLSLLTVCALISCAVPSYADMVGQFKGGVKDVIMSPLVVTDNIKTETDNAKFLPFALIGGLLKGGFYMGKQIVTGTLHIVTSPLEMGKK